ncbi:MAG: hypothetical protein EP318_01570 [Rhodobacteraceae bacterium]|nr:MAG: hypothetical protein EP318_01570 [Paracoccaceae bacterium]
MSGILPRMCHAEAAPGEASDRGFAEGESKDLLGRIREMGLLPDFRGDKGGPEAAPDAEDPDTLLDPIAAFETQERFDITSLMRDAEEVSDEAPEEEAPEEEALADAPQRPEPQEDHAPDTTLEDTAPDKATMEATPEDSPETNEVDALLTRLCAIAEAGPAGDTLAAPQDLATDHAPETWAPETWTEDESFDTDDGEIPVIADFIAGEDQLMLVMPEDMGADTAIRIEPAGEAGADAAIVLEDASGCLTAAVILGGFGSVTPEDIELERAA